MAEQEVVPRPGQQEQEGEDRSRREKARSYFQEHPRAKWGLLAILAGRCRSRLFLVAPLRFPRDDR
jgi:hypothetical protein